MKKIAELYLGDSDDDPDIVCCVETVDSQTHRTCDVPALN
jgi:hypothetical protein